MLRYGRVSEETKGEKNLPYSDGGVAPFDRQIQP